MTIQTRAESGQIGQHGQQRTPFCLFISLARGRALAQHVAFPSLSPAARSLSLSSRVPNSIFDSLQSRICNSFPFLCRLQCPCKLLFLQRNLQIFSLLAKHSCVLLVSVSEAFCSRRFACSAILLSVVSLFLPLASGRVAYLQS